jgi:hypothetical protein
MGYQDFATAEVISFKQVLDGGSEFDQAFWSALLLATKDHFEASRDARRQWIDYEQSEKKFVETYFESISSCRNISRYSNYGDRLKEIKTQLLKNTKRGGSVGTRQ